MIADERAVAQLAADLLEAAEISGNPQVALGGDDADLKLKPAIVVSAAFLEEARALKKNGNYGGRYRLDVDLRALREKPGTASLDTILGEIHTVLNTVPDQLPESAGVFSYYYIDERLGVESELGDETRELKRSYSVFALLT